MLAALAEHLAAQHDLAPPEWAELRVLQRPWFPAELKVQRADALVRTPPHSASTGSTCPLRTWKQRDRAWGVLLDRAFTALGERLVRRGVVADVFVVGGAAMALAYDATRVTRDVDSLFSRTVSS